MNIDIKVSKKNTYIFKKGKYALFIITPRILRSLSTNHPPRHATNHPKPQHLETLQAPQECKEPEMDTAREVVAVVGRPGVREDDGHLAVCGFEDEVEEDVSRDEPGEEEPGEGGVAEEGEGEVAEHFGELEIMVCKRIL